MAYTREELLKRALSGVETPEIAARARSMMAAEADAEGYPYEVAEAGLPVALLGGSVAGLAGGALKWLMGKVGTGVVGSAITGLAGAGLGVLGTSLLDDDDELADMAAGGMPRGDSPPNEIVAYKWNTGTAVFYRLIDGRIAVRKRNGVWRVYRPAKHIVLSRNPRVGQLLKADKQLTRMVRGMRALKVRRTAAGGGRRCK